MSTRVPPLVATCRPRGRARGPRRWRRARPLRRSIARDSAPTSPIISRPARSSVDVIVDGAAAADRLAAKYNLKVKRRLKSGGVLRVNAGQLSALQHDSDVDHLSGNIRYKSSAVDPVDEGIGADQVWAGAGPSAEAVGARRHRGA